MKHGWILCLAIGGALCAPAFAQSPQYQPQQQDQMGQQQQQDRQYQRQQDQMDQNRGYDQQQSQMDRDRTYQQDQDRTYQQDQDRTYGQNGDRDRDRDRDNGYRNSGNAQWRNSKAYKQGLKDGEHDRSKHKGERADRRHWKNDQDRQAYEAGYGEGYRGLTANRRDDQRRDRDRDRDH